MDQKFEKIEKNLDALQAFCFFIIALSLTLGCLLISYVLIAHMDYPKATAASVIAALTSVFLLIHAIKGLRRGYQEKTVLFRDKESLVKIILGTLLIFEIMALTEHDPKSMGQDDLALMMTTMAIVPYLLTIMQPLNKPESKQ